MSDLDLGQLFTSFSESAWRLETRDVYDVSSESDVFDAWKRDGVVPIRDDGWAELVSGHVRAGRRIGRVHIVEEPLTEYLRFELAAYEQNVAAGEEILIAWRRSMPSELRDLREDFWIFDNRIVAGMIYDAAGRYLGCEDWSADAQRYLSAMLRVQDFARRLEPGAGYAVG